MEIDLELEKSDKRNLDSNEIAKMWRKMTGEVPGVESISFTASLFNAGTPINIQLSSDNFELLKKLIDIFGDRFYFETQNAFLPGQNKVNDGIRKLARYFKRKIIGTVGALQFEVIQYRLEHEYGAKCSYENLNVHKACWIDVEKSDKNELTEFKRVK